VHGEYTAFPRLERVGGQWGGGPTSPIESLRPNGRLAYRGVKKLAESSDLRRAGDELLESRVLAQRIEVGIDRHFLSREAQLRRTVMAF
jgi:hypothetical protein